VEDRASLLYAPVTPASDDRSAVNQNRSDRNPAFGAPALCFFNRYIEV